MTHFPLPSRRINIDRIPSGKPNLIRAAQTIRESERPRIRGTLSLFNRG